MFEDLPKRVQEEVLYFLERDDFRTAKQIYSGWNDVNSPYFMTANKSKDAEAAPLKKL